jgi:hypothetical protein
LEQGTSNSYTLYGRGQNLSHDSRAEKMQCSASFITAPCTVNELKYNLKLSQSTVYCSAVTVEFVSDVSETVPFGAM